MKKISPVLGLVFLLGTVGCGNPLIYSSDMATKTSAMTNYGGWVFGPPSDSAPSDNGSSINVPHGQDPLGDGNNDAGTPVNPGSDTGSNPGSDTGSNPGSDTGSNPGSDTGSNPGSDSDCDHSDRDCKTDRFIQPGRPELRKLDLLVVVDASHHSNAGRHRLAESIGHLLRQLSKKVNVRVAVVPTREEDSRDFGRIYSSKKAPAVLRSDELSVHEMEHLLKLTLQHLPILKKHQTSTALFRTFLGATEGKALEENRELGFFRDDAALGVIFFEDKHAKVEERVSPDRVVERIRGLQQGRPYGIAAISDHRGCHKKEGKASHEGLRILLLKAAGASIDLEDKDPSDDILRLLVAKVSLVTEFKLRAGVDPQSIRVRVDGERVLYKLHRETGTVEIPAASAGHAGSVVEIHSCLSK